jgi:hypothetical protein
MEPQLKRKRADELRPAKKYGPKDVLSDKLILHKQRRSKLQKRMKLFE